MIVRVVRMTFKDENVVDFLRLFDNEAFKIRKMSGCHHLELMKDTKETNVFVTYSYWENDDLLDQYRHSEVFREIWQQCKKYFADKPMAFSMKRYLTVE
jgi:quinol monooxygenase YgiN